MLHTFWILIITLYLKLFLLNTCHVAIYKLCSIIDWQVLRLDYVDHLSALDELKSITVTNGEQCVMTAGTWTMLRWSADSWAVVQLWMPLFMPILVKVLDKSGLMMCNAQEVKNIWQAVQAVELG